MGTDRLAGICGNFNQMDSDDFLKRDGTTATNDGDLGDGWANELGCGAPRDTDYETVCAEHKDRENWAKKGEYEGHCFTLYFIQSHQKFYPVFQNFWSNMGRFPFHRNGDKWYRNVLGKFPQNPEFVKFVEKRAINGKFLKFREESQMERKRNFRKFRFTSRGCPLFWKLRAMLVHSSVKISRKLSRKFSSNEKRLSSWLDGFGSLHLGTMQIISSNSKAKRGKKLIINIYTARRPRFKRKTKTSRILSVSNVTEFADYYNYFNDNNSNNNNNYYYYHYYYYYCTYFETFS